MRERRNSIANALELVFPELTHQYYLQQHKAKRKSYVQRHGDTQLPIWTHKTQPIYSRCNTADYNRHSITLGCTLGVIVIICNIVLYWNML